MRFCNVFFDLDGTLTDPFEGLANAVLYALAKLSLPALPPETIRRFIGPPLVCSFAEICGVPRARAEEAARRYQEFYRETGLYQNRVYDGIPALLEKLRAAGARLFVATSKPRPFAEEVLRHFGLLQYFEWVSAVTFENPELGKDVLMEDILGKYALDRAKTAMTGDRRFDMAGAKAAKITAVGVLHGYGSEAELWESGADFVLKDAFALEKFFLTKPFDEKPC